jgi:hypothetical protein
VKRGGSLSFLVGTISNVMVMEIGWTDVGSGGYILVSCAHSKTSYPLYPKCECSVITEGKYQNRISISLTLTTHVSFP